MTHIGKKDLINEIYLPPAFNNKNLTIISNKNITKVNKDKKSSNSYSVKNDFNPDSGLSFTYPSGPGLQYVFVTYQSFGDEELKLIKKRLDQKIMTNIEHPISIE